MLLSQLLIQVPLLLLPLLLAPLLPLLYIPVWLNHFLWIMSVPMQIKVTLNFLNIFELYTLSGFHWKFSCSLLVCPRISNVYWLALTTVRVTDSLYILNLPLSSHSNGFWAKSNSTGLSLLACVRPLLAWTIMRHVLMSSEVYCRWQRHSLQARCTI